MKPQQLCQWRDEEDETSLIILFLVLLVDLVRSPRQTCAALVAEARFWWQYLQDRRRAGGKEEARDW